ncbi:ribosomal RNA large subunit methyltransferase N [Porphyromonas crevioricanis]|uniref:Probable dual-specificity RNA methyltransferase RlmN n=1 Tax=Porphyromonas crevioricanis JCM 15906 TaxID=1305617 RepID=T1CQK7_9PORP|nr:23S rRNA (adenine(2503)-C(2))-methyltransferase RlmN [Porphyromonas crevioricanis]KGN91039.1 ribosomal RNA large subunit methyltransferase N [Porphyromonas crevioricanis]GAD05363.1 ribosomal RNA large subunit methyltransferase N [Porphyromonas crevioricanis JCM 15906]SJZ56884.1 23S rRNA (adenine2503-C2)-methyltransferase [Porphyromonas crevioricanis]
MEQNKKPLLGLSLQELQEIVIRSGMPKFTAKQIADWLYVKRISQIEEMTNLSLSNREKLSQEYTVGRYAPQYVQQSADGTRKYLFRIKEGQYVESVMIPDKGRYTLCISTQVGCKMNCLFCMTGKQGFSGHLSAAEIINQIFSVEEASLLTNIVYMGMGEPLDNLSAVMKSISILTSNWGIAWSPKRITLSTIGVTKALETFLKECNCHLAISIHNAIPEERAQIMPTEKAFPIERTIELLRQHNFGGQRKLSFEYIVFGKLNDTLNHANRLSTLLKGLPALINLIRYHRIPNVDLPSTDEDRLIQFKEMLERKGHTVTIRQSRGEDIAAACGMLSALEGRI